MPTALPAPALTIGAVLRVLPPPLVRLVLRRVGAALPRRHPALIRRLRRMAPARILFAPSDLPHRFLLDIAAGGVRLRLAAEDEAGEVTMRGRLATLLDLLESRIDSDTVFFSRDLSVSGTIDTAVAFRNTLDGEAINLTEDALAPLGRLAGPARRVLAGVRARTDRLAERVAALRDAAHRAAHDGHDPERERDVLREQLDGLVARVARLEGRGRRAREEA
jgi:O2-independent ubiquinone biosynthesis accessory factor UbiT